MHSMLSKDFMQSVLNHSSTGVTHHFQTADSTWLGLALKAFKDHFEYLLLVVIRVLKYIT